MWAGQEAESGDTTWTSVRSVSRTKLTSSGHTTIMSMVWSMSAGLTWTQVVTLTGGDVASLSVPLRDGYETFGVSLSVKMYCKEKAT